MGSYKDFCNVCVHKETCDKEYEHCAFRVTFVQEYLERMKSQAGKRTSMGIRDEDGFL